MMLDGIGQRQGLGGAELAGFLELFEVEGGKFDTANEGFAFAEAVAVGAAGDEEIETLCQGEIMFGEGWAVLGMETFQTIETLGGQGGNDFVVVVQTWVGHDGEAAGLVN